MTAAVEGVVAVQLGLGGGDPPPVVSGGLPLLGHLLELRRDPLRFMARVHEECGEIGEFNLAGNRIASRRCAISPSATITCAATPRRSRPRSSA
jgi:hypothetical protein